MKNFEPPLDPFSSSQVSNRTPAADIDFEPSTGIDPANGKPRQRSYLIRHWRGELPLARSFWVNGVLLNIIASIFIYFLTETLLSPSSYNHSNLKAIFASNAFLLVSTITITIWQLTGIWRSATRYLNQGNSLLWGTLARILIVIGILGLGSDLRQSYYSISELYKITFQRDSLGSYQLRILRNETELEVSGAITFGLTDDTQKILDKHPKIHIIHLNSEGGRVLEARKLRDLIESRQLTTFTSSSCASACTLAYAAGKERLIAKGAWLGFHQSSLPGMTRYDPLFQDRKDREDWKARGFNKTFIEKAFTTPNNTLWKPTHKELFEYGFVTGYPKHNDVAVTSISSKQVDNINTLLLEHPLFSALKTHEPETYQRITEELQSGLKQGQSITELRKKVFPIIQPVFIERIPYSSDTALRSLINLSLEQIRTLESINPSLCYDYIYGQEDPARVEIIQLFPAEMQQKELSVMTEIILSSTNKTSPLYNQKQVEKQLQFILASLTKQYGKDAQILLDPESEKVDKAKMCKLTYALYETILTLPDQKSGPLLRYMFSNAK